MYIDGMLMLKAHGDKVWGDKVVMMMAMMVTLTTLVDGNHGYQGYQDCLAVTKTALQSPSLYHDDFASKVWMGSSMQQPASVSIYC